MGGCHAQACDRACIEASQHAMSRLEKGHITLNLARISRLHGCSIECSGKRTCDSACRRAHCPAACRRDNLHHDMRHHHWLAICRMSPSTCRPCNRLAYARWLHGLLSCVFPAQHKCTYFIFYLLVKLVGCHPNGDKSRTIPTSHLFAI